MIKKTFLSLIFLAISFSAHSTAISFSFFDDPSDFPLIGRGYSPGTVTGLLVGLSVDGVNQLPTAIEFTSDVSSLGITNNIIDVFSISLGTGFNIVDGNIIDANLLLNFIDPIIGGMQIRFNFDGMNLLHWNGGTGPGLGMGNQNGFSGADYGVSTVPVPAAAWLFGSALLGFFGFSRRKANA